MDSHHGQWILLVDDDATFRGLLAELLTLNGYTVYETRSANEATEAVMRRDPGLAIVDYRLPDQDGVAWITKMREAGNTFPIVFLSGTWCDMKLFNRLRNLLNVSLILQKPIEPALFIDQLGNLLPPVASQPTITEDFIDQAATMDAQASVYNMPQLKHPDKIQQALEKARQRFALELPERVQLLTQSVHTAKEIGLRADVMRIASGEAHKLKGAAGSFGFIEIGEMAGIVERLLLDLEPNDPTMLDLLWSEINKYLANSEALAQAAAKEAGAGGLQIGAPLPEVGHSVPLTVLFIGSPRFHAEIEKDTMVAKAETLCTASPMEAMEIIRSRPIHTLVIDLGFCDINAALLLSRDCRLTPGCESLPIIAIADEDQELDQAALLHLGASGLLRKPVDVDEFSATLDAALDWVEPQLSRVLTVDDDQAITDLVQTVLSGQGINVRALHEPIRILETLEEFQPDAVLLDVNMPGLSGYDVCRMLREREEWSDMPVLFLTTRSDMEGRNMAFTAGASDFLAKPILSHELTARIKAQIANSPRARKRHDKDLVTGLTHRTALEQQFEAYAEAAKANNEPLVFCLIDFNGLNSLRAEYGMQMAEQALTSLGRALITRFRAEDLKGQLSDMFVIIFPRKTSAEVQPALQKFREELKTDGFFTQIGDGFNASISYGLAQLNLDSDNGLELLDVAFTRLRRTQAQASVLGT